MGCYKKNGRMYYRATARELRARSMVEQTNQAVNKLNSKLPKKLRP